MSRRAPPFEVNAWPRDDKMTIPVRVRWDTSRFCLAGCFSIEKRRGHVPVSESFRRMSPKGGNHVQRAPFFCSAKRADRSPDHTGNFFSRTSCLGTFPLGNVGR